jgi:transposase
MDVLHAHCAGLDVHKDTVVACARVGGAKVLHHLETFPTTTRGLLALSEWLSGHGVTHVAMEATGVYWKPVWHLLEGNFELTLANPQHIKSVPGRKTDVRDAQWIADLMAHGLIEASFVPPEPIQDLRDLTRARKQLVRETVQHTQRIQKVLQDCNIKLDSVLSSVVGKSGRAMLRAMIAGESDPAKLSELALGKAQKKKEALKEALRGKVRAHHRSLLGVHLGVLESLEKSIAEVDALLGKALASMREQLRLLTTIPGVSDLVAQTLIAEIGVDMTRFPTVEQLISWAGLCPRSDESAGKKRSTRLRKGSAWLKTMLVQAAWSAVRTKGTYLRAQFYRLTRRGPKKAIVAVAASILTAAYFMLRDGVEYRELGADHYSKRDESKVVARLTRRLRDMGYEVEMRKAA